MSRTITRLFDDYADAQTAVTELERLGVSHSDLSIVANNADAKPGHDGDHDVTDVNDHGDVSRGASTGAVLGGVGGLLAGLGLLAIPGLGPIVAAGWLASTVAGAAIGGVGGAATGSLVGALKNAGHTEDEANVYSEGVRRGGTLVSAKVDDQMVGEAEAILDGNRGVTAATRGPVYREAGWNRFDEAAAPYSAEEMERDRAAYRREPSVL
ncbi:general stress protein [Sphingomonas sp. ASY06-1R]|uniref:general stress protein n=1 Tax=Sphingomonas sp. ASY06-1R TaxID=3445771 RepID=UPI003FA2DDF0